MAREMIDIGISDTEDLFIVGGDFLMTECTAHHQRQLILNNNADFKQNPTICVGAFEYLDDENYQELLRKVSLEFTKDGMDVKSVRLDTNGLINTDAYYP